MGLISGGLGTIGDSVTGFVLITIGSVSILLNGFVLEYLRRQTPNPTRTLFKLLAVIDILTSLSCTYVFGYFILKVEEIPTNERDLLYEPSTRLEVAHFCVYFILAYLPCCIFPTATVLRYVAIRSPLIAMTNIHTVSMLSIQALPPSVAVVTVVVLSARHYWHWCYKLIYWEAGNGFVVITYVAAKSLCCIIQVINVIMTTYVVFYLHKRSKRLCRNAANHNMHTASQKSNTAMTKMLCNSLGSMLYFGSDVTVMLFGHVDMYTEINDCLSSMLGAGMILLIMALPCFLSLYNPLIFVIFSPDSLRIFSNQARP